MSSLNSRNSTTVQGGSHNRKLRYRALLEDLSTVDDENLNSEDCMTKTANAVREAQSLLVEGGVEERVKHPGEGYLDSRVLRATSDLTIRCSEAISGNTNVYDKHELAQHIRDNPKFWEFSFPLELTPIVSIYGTFAPTPVEQRARAPRKRVERQKDAALKEPESVDKLDKIEEGSEMVTRVNQHLTKLYKNGGEKPLSYFHVVLDPHSFSTTVENIYYISFLARDGMVSVQVDEEYGLPFIRPMRPSQNSQEDISEENQFIVSIDMDLWKDLIKEFNIRKPMMVIKRH